MSLWTRLWRFNTIGAAGLAVQLSVLALFVEAAGLHYALSTALAVEAAVLHNFFWHRRWTWSDRPRDRAALRLLRFNLTTGLVSLVANVALMRLFVGYCHIPYLPANLLSVACCSLANFALGDRWVFRDRLAPEKLCGHSRSFCLPSPPAPLSRPTRVSTAAGTSPATPSRTIAPGGSKSPAPKPIGPKASSSRPSEAI